MGFDVNFNPKPIIKETQAMHDGGAGNLGYFEQEKKKQSDKNKSIFAGSEEIDTFGNPKEEEEESFSISKFIAQIILAVKDWFKKLFK